MVTLSETENKTLMYEARDALRGIWGLAIGIILTYIVIISSAQMVPKVGGLISLILTGPMTLGLCRFALAISRKQNARFSQLFDGFQNFGVTLGAYLLQTIFILLWSLLLIIPGIIAVLAYSQTFFIIAENDTIGPLEAITKSKEIMAGNKWKLFRLGCRFIGWSLLCVLTLGIGFLWLGPYMAISYAKFYGDIIKNETF